MTTMTSPRRIRQLTIAGLLGLAALAGSSASASDGEAIPIIDSGEVETCDEDAISLVLQDGKIYAEIETDAGLEWRDVTHGTIHYGFPGSGLRVLFEIDHGDQTTIQPLVLYVSVDGGPEAMVLSSRVQGTYVIDDPGSIYAFDWESESSENVDRSPTTADVIFEPSTNCPPPTIDDIDDPNE